MRKLVILTGALLSIHVHVAVFGLFICYRTCSTRVSLQDFEVKGEIGHVERVADSLGTFLLIRWSEVGLGVCLCINCPCMKILVGGGN